MKPETASSRPVNTEQRLKELAIQLPPPPEPFGIYAEAVRTGNLLFLTGMLPTEGREAKFVGRVGAEVNVEAGGAKLRASPQSTPLLLPVSIWDRSTRSRGSMVALTLVGGSRRFNQGTFQALLCELG